MEDFKEWMYEVKRIPLSEYEGMQNLALIGYMEEYLLHKKGLGVGNPSDIYMRIHDGEEFGDIRFYQLMQEIERR